MLIISILVVIYSCSKHFYGGNKHKTILNPTFPITQVNPKEMNKEVGGGDSHKIPKLLSFRPDRRFLYFPVTHKLGCLHFDM